jgi:hypothetical protein
MVRCRFRAAGLPSQPVAQKLSQILRAASSLCTTATTWKILGLLSRQEALARGAGQPSLMIMNSLSWAASTPTFGGDASLSFAGHLKYCRLHCPAFRPRCQHHDR